MILARFAMLCGSTILAFAPIFLSGCVATRCGWPIPDECCEILEEVARRYAMTGTVASESDGLVYGLTNRGVKPEWFVGLGGRIEGDASCPGAKYRSADGRILEFRRKRNGLGFWIEFQGVDGKATHDVDFCIARVTGKEPSSTAISTIDDLPYIYIDKDQRLFVNLKAREGRVRVDPRTGLMLEGE